MTETDLVKANGHALSVEVSADGRRTFDAEFKRNALLRVRGGEDEKAVSQELDVSVQMLRRWEKAGLPRVKKALPGGVTIDAAGRKVYPEALKRALVARAESGTEKIDVILREAKVHSSMLANWRKKYGKNNSPAPSPKSARPKFDEAAKIAALARIDAGEPSAAVAKDLGVRVGQLHTWRWELKKNGITSAALDEPQGPTVSRVIKDIRVRDAISFLKHAKDDMHERLARGDIKEFDQAHLLSLMALNALLKSN